MLVTVPFTVGDRLNAVLAERSRPVELAGISLAWAIWALVAIAASLALPGGLTLLRLAAPTMAAAAVVVTASAPVTVWGSLGVASAVLIAAISMLGAIADHCVNGSAYGDERRFALRLPVGFVVGPVPAAWAVLAGGLVGGVLAVAARSWFLGAALLATSGLAGWRFVPAFHALSSRWLVMVPAGITLVDHLTLAEPTLFARNNLRSVGPALSDTDAIDLSGHALGTPIELRLDRPTEIIRRISAQEAEATLVSAILISPASPAAVLRELDVRSGGVFPSVP